MCSKYVQLTADFEKKASDEIVGSLNLRWCRRFECQHMYYYIFD